MTDVYRQIIDQLSRCKRVLVTTHVRPDGDAIGTATELNATELNVTWTVIQEMSV